MGFLVNLIPAFGVASGTWSALGAFLGLAALKRMQSGWRKAERKFAEDWERVGDGLESDLRVSCLCFFLPLSV